MSDEAEKTYCHCSRESLVQESGRFMCTGCDKMTDFCKGDRCNLGGDKGKK